jgi:hypothetical protein
LMGNYKVGLIIIISLIVPLILCIFLFLSI